MEAFNSAKRLSASSSRAGGKGPHPPPYSCRKRTKPFPQSKTVGNGCSGATGRHNCRITAAAIEFAFSSSTTVLNNVPGCSRSSSITSSPSSYSSSRTIPARPSSPPSTIILRAKSSGITNMLNFLRSCVISPDTTIPGILCRDNETSLSREICTRVKVEHEQKEEQSRENQQTVHGWLMLTSRKRTHPQEYK